MDDRELVERAARRVVAEHDPRKVSQREFLGAVYDAGLAWVRFPVGLGGLGVARGLQEAADRILRAAGGPDPFVVNAMGYGMAAPTMLEHGRPELYEKLLRPLATGEHIWCQMFSEPGAGSDLAGLATMAVRDGADWRVTGQKVWTSRAHEARYGLLLARSDPDAPKHRGLTYFVIGMDWPGVEVRPLRQMTGNAEFNEVYLTDVKVPDLYRLGEVGDGWRVAMTTLMNERSALGGHTPLSGATTIADALELWAERPDLHTPVMRDRLAGLWIEARALRLDGERGRAIAATGAPGPEATVSKLAGAELNQRIYAFCIELLGLEGTLYGSYDAPAPDFSGPIQQRFLRSRANTIEGGTSDILRNILGERVLGLPGEPRDDTRRPWREVPRG